MANAATSSSTLTCRSADSVLVVVDIQQRLGDAMPGKVLNRVLQNTALLARTCALLEVPVIKTEQYPRGLGPTHASVGAALPAHTMALEKLTFSCCGVPEFSAALARSGRRFLRVLDLEHHDLRALAHRVADADKQLAHDARRRRRDLHCRLVAFEHKQRLLDGDVVADLHQQLDHFNVLEVADVGDRDLAFGHPPSSASGSASPGRS